MIPFDDISERLAKLEPHDPQRPVQTRWHRVLSFPDGRTHGLRLRLEACAPEHRWPKAFTMCSKTAPVARA